MSTKDRPRAICFGDSITQYGDVVWESRPKIRGKADDDGDVVTEEEEEELKPLEAGWLSIVRNRYARRFDVMNRGYSGYNTKMARVLSKRVFLCREDDAISKGNVAGSVSTTAAAAEKKETFDPFVFATVFFGANDSADPGENPTQGLTPSEYETHLRYIVSVARSMSRQVIVISPPCVDHTKWKDRKNERVESFTAAAGRVARETSSDFINLYSIMKNVSRTPEVDFLRDGLHLNGKGNMLLAREVVRSVDRYQHEVRHRRKETESSEIEGKTKSPQEAPPTPITYPFWEIVGTLDRADRVSAVPLDFPLWRHMSNTDPESSVRSIGRLGYYCTNRNGVSE